MTIPKYATKEERLAGQRLADKLRKRGTPQQVQGVEFEAALRMLNRARASGMDDAMIGGQIGINHHTIYMLRCGYRKSLHRSTYEAIMRLRPEVIQAPRVHPTAGKIPDGSRRDATGTRRRARALRAEGFSNPCLASYLGVTPEAVSEMTRREGGIGVYYTTYRDYKELYEKLAGTNPGDHGVSELGQNRAKKTAQAKLWAPSWCWDEDTIDDPDAIPEWTGRCGELEGYVIHHHADIPVCEACSAAVGGLKPKPAAIIRENFDFSPARLAGLLSGARVAVRQIEIELGIPDGVMRRWARGDYAPRADTARRVAQYFDIPWWDLYTRKEEG